MASKKQKEKDGMEPKAPKAEKVRESEVSKKARARKQEPEELAALKTRKMKEVTLRAIELGFDGEKRIRPGVMFTMKVPVDGKGDVVLPTWAVLPEDYKEPEPVGLPPGMKPKIRGGATVGGVKPQL